jgi:hypothetical protein
MSDTQFIYNMVVGFAVIVLLILAHKPKPPTGGSDD